jgi:glycosyltransferase involved in cell wall biosynthesis
MDKLTTGGAEVYFVKLENGIDRNKINLFTAAGRGELSASIKQKNKFVFLSRKNHLKNIYTINKIMKQNNIDIIHANCLRVAIYAIFLNFIRRKKVGIIYSKHNVTFLERHFKSIFKSLLNKHINKIITVSNFEKKNLIKLGILSKKIINIYNGVDLNQFQFTSKNKKDSDFKIGILARLSPEKNHSLFLDIAKLFKNEHKFKFYIAGDGPEYQYLQEKIAKLKLSNSVKMLGNVSNPEEFIKEMDVLLLTSHREVFPMTIIEAMAVGTPVITVDVGGVKEAIEDNFNSFLIKNYDPHQFYNKIKYLVENDSIREQFIKRSREKVEKYFSLNQMIEQITREYFNVYDPKDVF